MLVDWNWNRELAISLAKLSQLWKPKIRWNLWLRSLLSDKENSQLIQFQQLGGTMEGEEGFKVGKKSTTGDKGGEVDYRTKAGTAWSHNFLNQKPWHPLSYPNQRRKWIAEQTHAHRQRRSEEVAREVIIHCEMTY